jgi:hypothetical protein
MLADLIPQGSVLAEIGVFAGDFSDWMFKALNPKKLYGIDPYMSTIGVMGSGNVHGYGMEFYELDLLYGFVKNRFSKHPAYEFRRECSGPFFDSIPDGSLDAVYIDGDHSLPTVRDDLEKARLAVKEGGWICGHDYDLTPGKGNSEIKHIVKSVVDEFCAKYNLTLEAISQDGIQSFAIRNTNKYKICVVSVSDRPALYSKTFSLFQHYTQKHGYALQVHTELLDGSRHASWSKIPALKLALQDTSFDYVVWMDDDIVITNPEISLSHFIDTHNFRKKQACVMVSSDMPNEPSTSMNCGIFFIKGGGLPSSMNLLSTAWSYADVCPILKQSCSWEQEAFNFLYRYADRDAFHIIPLPNFQAPTRFQADPAITWKHGYFAAHLNNGPLQIKLMTYDLLAKVCKFPA